MNGELYGVSKMFDAAFTCIRKGMGSLDVLTTLLKFPSLIRSEEVDITSFEPRTRSDGKEFKFIRFIGVRGGPSDCGDFSVL